MKTTIEDVAKEAQVSITTVSRVLNNNYPVKESTRKKVEKAIAKLNFTPNSLARGLIRKRTYTVGVIVPSMTNLFFPEVVKGIEDCMGQNEYTLFLCDTKSEPEYERRHVERLKERQVDGIVVIGPMSENIKSGFFEALTKEVPLVLVNGYHRGVRCNFILTDEEMGTLEALEYLQALGHRDIAFLRGEQIYSYDVKEEIFTRVMKQSNIPVMQENILVIPQGNSVETVDMSRDMVIRRLEKGNPPTAIFCCNDWMATGAINAAKHLGVRVPEDFSIIGFDNIVISQLSEPKLTTIDQTMLKLGQGAAALLLEVIEGKKGEGSLKKVILETKLVKRNSCAVASRTV